MVDYKWINRIEADKQELIRRALDYTTRFGVDDNKSIPTQVFLLGESPLRGL